MDEIDKYLYNDITNIIFDYVGPFLLDYFPNHTIESVYKYYDAIITKIRVRGVDNFISITIFQSWEEYLKKCLNYNPIDFKLVLDYPGICFSNNDYHHIIRINNIDKDHNTIYKYLKDKNLIQYKTKSIFN